MILLNVLLTLITIVAMKHNNNTTTTAMNVTDPAAIVRPVGDLRGEAPGAQTVPLLVDPSEPSEIRPQPVDRGPVRRILDHLRSR